MCDQPEFDVSVKLPTLPAVRVVGMLETILEMIQCRPEDPDWYENANGNGD